MSRLIVKNVGPIKEIDIDLRRINVFCGPQSSGKSTVAKIISFCSWLEKIADSDDLAAKSRPSLISKMETYFRMKSYIRNDSAILYVGENIAFAYNWPNKIGSAETGFDPYGVLNNGNEQIILGMQKVINPKVIYIPAERNFVASVPSLRKYTEGDDSLQSFVNAWYEAKRNYTEDKSLKIGDLGVRYYYNEDSDRDFLVMDNGKKLLLTDSSSGIQSAVPLSVMIDWMSSRIYETNKPFSPEENQRINEIFTNFSDSTRTAQEEELINRLKGFISGRIYSHTQFIIEEPEQNLFPLTQRDLVYRLLAATNHGRNHRMVMTTHSPYILYALNNAMTAYIVRGNMPEDKFKELESSEYAVNPEDVALWEIHDGRLVSIKDGNTGTIGAHYFNSNMNAILDEFYKMLQYLK